ncbi:hypothetical protein [European catfish virus]|uniref:Uncharacterized protein n=1 Tax=European catfish virus TaxID=84739 RepID=I2BFV7_9VIRU|nr:hypothetical protein A190_gp127 [European catfish virus]AFJ52410.1 hypothetical protein [European catfish virus]AMZ04956.1 hypothetical protein [European catfish virus]AMZ05092.1 hypothetical protein [European catfish virus]
MLVLHYISDNISQTKSFRLFLSYNLSQTKSLSDDIFGSIPKDILFITSSFFFSLVHHRAYKT